MLTCRSEPVKNARETFNRMMSALVLNASAEKDDS